MAENSPRTESNASPLPLVSAEDFGALYARRHLDIFRFIYALHGGPRETVEDLAADTFFRAWNARRKFDGDAQAALAWLLRIARNLVIDAHRREKFRGIPDDLDQIIVPAPDLSPEQAAIFSERAAALWQALQALPDEDREAVALRYILGWRVKAIAEHMNITENTASQKLRRALQKIRKDWPDEA